MVANLGTVFDSGCFWAINLGDPAFRAVAPTGANSQTLPGDQET
jgi:hypothetical protein